MKVYKYIIRNTVKDLPDKHVHPSEGNEFLLDTYKNTLVIKEVRASDAIVKNLHIVAPGWIIVREDGRLRRSQ